METATRLWHVTETKGDRLVRNNFMPQSYVSHYLAETKKYPGIVTVLIGLHEVTVIWSDNTIVVFWDGE